MYLQACLPDVMKFFKLEEYFVTVFSSFYSSKTNGAMYKKLQR